MNPDFPDKLHLSTEYHGKLPVRTELTTIEADPKAPRLVGFTTYIRQGLDLLQRPGPTEKGNLFTDPKPIALGTKVYSECPFSENHYWEFTVTKPHLAESEGMIVNLGFDEHDKCWVALCFCSKAALKKIKFTE